MGVLGENLVESHSDVTNRTWTTLTLNPGPRNVNPELLCGKSRQITSFKSICAMKFLLYLERYRISTYWKYTDKSVARMLCLRTFITFE
jgi:hypothetical protein